MNLKCLFFLIVPGLVICCTNNQNKSGEKIKESAKITIPLIVDTITLTDEELKDDSLDDAGYPTGTTWEHAGIKDSVLFKKFVKYLKTWVANGEKELIAGTLDYPLSNPVIENREDFIANYEKYFSDKVKNALLSQKLSQIYHDRLGIRIQNGEIWLKQTEDGFKIVAINN